MVYTPGMVGSIQKKWATPVETRHGPLLVFSGIYINFQACKSHRKQPMMDAFLSTFCNWEWRFQADTFLLPVFLRKRYRLFADKHIRCSQWHEVLHPMFFSITPGGGYSSKIGLDALIPQPEPCKICEGMCCAWADDGTTDVYRQLHPKPAMPAPPNRNRSRFASPFRHGSI